MPVQLKDPSIEEERLVFKETDGALEVEAILHEPSASHDSVVKFFAPHAFVAKTEFETRKEKQKVHREWMQNIALRKNQLQLNQQRISEMVKNSRNNNNGGISM